MALRHGHRLLPHTADLIIEAWAADRPSCLSEAVAALTSCFADLSSAQIGEATAVAVRFVQQPDEERLVEVLEEVIFELDVDGVVVVGSELTDDTDGGTVGVFLVVPASAVTQIGPIPKAVARSQLALTHTPTGWRATATIDV